MATDLPMNPQMEQIHGEIRDNFRVLANGFQKLDKIKDPNRQSKQLEELTRKMRECKRLIKEFDREIKDEEGRNPSEANKQLNDEKQSLIKELNSYVGLRKTYMSSLGNKKVELFDMGAGRSEPTAEENVQMASCEEKRDHLVGWDLVCRPKEEGGLGLGNLVSKNISLVGKWLWRYPLEPDSLWHRVIKSKFGSHRSCWDVVADAEVSYLSPWRFISEQ